MVSFLVLTAIVLGAPGSDVLGVVRVAEKRVLISAPESEAALARTGDRIRSRSTIETGVSGWSELHLASAGRVRISAASRITVLHDVERGRDELRLHTGRIWVQHSGEGKGEPLAVVIDELRITVGPRSSVI